LAETPPPDTTLRVSGSSTAPWGLRVGLEAGGDVRDALFAWCGGVVGRFVIRMGTPWTVVEDGGDLAEGCGVLGLNPCWLAWHF
jgi:hypothetical protein